MEKILVPQINGNEDQYVIKRFYVSERQAVHSGDVLADLSSSKAVVEITTDISGYLHLAKEELAEVKVGETLALIFDTMSEYEEYVKKDSDAASDDNKQQQYTLTKIAEDFVKAHGLTHEELASLHKKVIKTSDLQLLLNKRDETDTRYQPVSPEQKMVAQTVNESYQTIPRAFLLQKVDCTKTHIRMMELTKEFGTVIGFGEVITVILSEIFADFSIFFARLVDENTIELPQSPSIGITYDVGNGLFIPVIKAGQAGSLEEVIDVSFENKVKALRGTFSTEDLSGGTISISLNTNNDVVAVLPIILPGQTAMISVGAVMKELTFDIEDKTRIIEKEYLNLGIAYDHRVVNGFNTMEFSDAIKRKLESFDLKVYRN
ncbi:2-oxo acid dehydrogenase subunit E2 [Paenibacillus polymyxa]|uniref:2-oxo acid dehydrogenase subunit E2 n=1 Tax=Paenibacillus polymyxa TaxID=1406 RepID=UPI003217583C